MLLEKTVYYFVHGSDFFLASSMFAHQILEGPLPGLDASNQHTEILASETQGIRE